MPHRRRSLAGGTPGAPLWLMGLGKAKRRQDPLRDAHNSAQRKMRGKVSWAGCVRDVVFASLASLFLL